MLLEENKEIYGGGAIGWDAAKNVEVLVEASYKIKYRERKKIAPEYKEKIWKKINNLQNYGLTLLNM